jgi:NADPH2:quinone reductase
MRAIEAETFSGYGGLRQVELPKPQPTKDRVLVRVAAAGVTPLDHTILSGGHPRAKAPLVLGNEGAGVIEDAGNSGLAVGSRVMFTGPYGVRENGAWQEWLLARPEDLAFVPDAIDDVVAASLPVAYLTAQITLTLAAFKPGMTVLAPAIGGSVCVYRKPRPFDLMKESRTVVHDGRATLLPFEAVTFALQADQPTRG